jgi:hypothetical protein
LSVFLASAESRFAGESTLPPQAGNASRWAAYSKNMLSTHSVEKYLEHFNPELRDIVRELRSIIYSVAPEATEVARRNGLIYFYQQRGGPVSAGICQIMIQADHIRLAFIHGAFLSDPGNLLEGNQQYKRFVRINSFERAPWEALKNLIASSSRFDPRTLGEDDLASFHRHE